MTRCGFHYKPGLNDLTQIWTNPFVNEILHGDSDIDNSHMVCYFTDVENILQYVNYGPLLCGVIPKSKEIYAPEVIHAEDGEIPGWYADKVWLSRPKELWLVDTFEYLINRGAKIIYGDYDLFKTASYTNSQVFRYLMNQIKSIPEVYEDIKNELESSGFM